MPISNAFHLGGRYAHDAPGHSVELAQSVEDLSVWESVL